MNRDHILPTAVASLIGLAAVLLVLFAWHLPPFSGSRPSTENAYIRGRITTLAPQLSGYLSEVAVSDFQDVEAGDLIARIDDRIFRQKLAQAEASLAAANAALLVARQGVTSAEAAERSLQATLAAALSERETAQVSAQRSHALKDRGITSQASLDDVNLALQKADAAVRQAQAQLDVQKEAIASAKTQVTSREAEISRAVAALELARIDLVNTEIRAPEAGKLGQVAARVGQYVTPGTALVSLVGTDLWVIANFKETQLPGIRPGQLAWFNVDALNGQAFTGKVAAFSPATASEFSVLAGSNATGNFTKIAQRLPVRIAIDPDQDTAALAPGMSVEITVGE